MVLDQPPEPPSLIAERTGALRMTLGEHVEDLRRHLIWALAGVGVALAITGVTALPYIIPWLMQPLLQAMEAQGYPPQAYAFDPTAGFTVYMNVSLIGALILSGPWVVYQAWRFVVLGLHEHERRAVHALWPFSAVMTALGVAFTYYVLMPVALMFFYGFVSMYPKVDAAEPGWMFRMLMPQVERAPEAQDTGVSGGAQLRIPAYDADPAQPVEGEWWINRVQRKIKVRFDGRTHVVALQQETMLTPMPDAAQYVTFAAWMGLGVVIAFQLPVVMMVVGYTGLVDPQQVAKLRKYALFLCFAAGAILTPTDVLSMFVLSVPLYGLFELGLWMMRRTFQPEGP